MKQKEKKILENNNFRNNQNYVIWNDEKNNILDFYISINKDMFPKGNLGLDILFFMFSNIYWYLFFILLWNEYFLSSIIMIILWIIILIYYISKKNNIKKLSYKAFYVCKIKNFKFNIKNLKFLLNWIESSDKNKFNKEILKKIEENYLILRLNWNNKNWLNQINYSSNNNSVNVIETDTGHKIIF